MPAEALILLGMFAGGALGGLLSRWVPLSGWVALLAQGTTRSQVVLTIEQSQEYRTRLVDRLYTTLLGRPAWKQL